MAAEFKKIGVIGAGQMGAGIAQVCAIAGISTSLFDAKPEAAEKALSGITKQLQRQVDKEKISADGMQQALSNIHVVSSLQEVADNELLIEAIVENIEIKQELFKSLDSMSPKAALFASNTSSISITRLASVTKRAEQCIGLHFMNPVPVMQLVEVIRGLQTSEVTYERGLSLVAQLEKTPVTAQRDYPGFIVNRILVPMINEAFYVLMEGIADAEDIDAAMHLGTNQPMGPLKLADFVGLDTCLAICEIFHNELGEDKYRPCPLLRKYVEAGWFGRKVGKGVYSYPE